MIFLSELESRLVSLPKGQEIVLYCALPKEVTVARRPAEYLRMGYTNVKASKGEVEAWEGQGYPLIRGN
ncbi:MAG: rhodanese-like domain-containing protein [Thermodesulfobacteriota bacterium]